MIRKCSITLLVAIATIGCERKPPSIIVTNIPPDTHIFVEGMVDTVPARQIIHWWGNDPDGWVVGYHYNWDNSPDTVFTTATCDTFVLSAEDTVNLHILRVWAEDNEGAIDTTPAELIIPVRNSPPTVSFKYGSLPADTTFPVATFYLEAHDIDGDESVAGFYYKLDTDTMLRFTPSDTPYVTLRDIEPGQRTFIVWAVDISNARSDSISHTWWVKPVLSDLLVVDDDPDNQADRFYLDALESMGYTPNVWRIEDGLPYSPIDVDIIINELGFNKILWYTGKDISHLSEAQKPIERYLNAGKKLLLISSATLNAFYDPEIPSPFPYDYLGVDTATVVWDKLIPAGTVIRRDTNVTGYPDSLKVSIFLSRFDAFEAQPQAEIIYRLPESGLWEGTPGVAVRYPVDNPIVIFFSMPLHRLNGFNNAINVINYIFEHEFME